MVIGKDHFGREIKAGDYFVYVAGIRRSYDYRYARVKPDGKLVIVVRSWRSKYEPINGRPDLSNAFLIEKGALPLEIAEALEEHA